MRPYSRVYATVNLDAVVSNMKAMREALPASTAIMGVVKADGYGHGAVPVAWAMDPYVEGYAVSNIDEGINLRRHGIQKPILILGVTHRQRFEELLQYKITPAMFRLKEAKELSCLAKERGLTAKIHLALDTGMSRIGMAPSRDAAKEAAGMASLPGIEIEGLFTHFARADEYDRSPAMVQLERYLDFSRRVEEAGVEIPLHHCSNSAGIIRMPEANLNIVRAGITIYGIYPSSEVERDIVKLEPVMELKSHVTYVKDVPAGAAISYGGTYVADRKLRVATVPVGYADGYSRQLSNKGWVLIHGQKAPILGRVCMDQFMVDVTEIGDVKKGDEVTLIGRDGDEFIGIEEIGDLCGRFSYEFACDISPRVPRVYIKNGKEI